MAVKLTQPRPRMDQVEASAPTPAAFVNHPLESLEPEQAPPPLPEEVPAVEYPKDLYELAHIENDHRTFEARLAEACQPVVKEYTPPPVPVQIAENTRREMEAGRRRVAEFAELESKRQATINEPRKKEPWEGTNTPVFRPGEFDEYKTTMKSPVLTQSKDIRR